MATKIVIVMDGGLIQEVFSNGEVEVISLDFDTQDMDEKELVRLRDVEGMEGEPCFMNKPYVEKNRKWVNGTFKRAEELKI